MWKSQSFVCGPIWVSCIFSDRAVPCHIKFLRSQKVVHISCGDGHTAALTKVGITTLGHRCSDLLFTRELCVLTEHESIFCCRSHRMEACLHLVMARGGNWVTAPPAMNFYPDECWSWWVLRCPRSPVAGTFYSKLGARRFIPDCT